MAKPEHLEILKQGVEAWNGWREENPRERPDLSRADLRKLELRHFDFKKSKFFGTNLDKALLDDCDLHRANFRDASAVHASFMGSKCADARFLRANLQEAMFVGAVLCRAKLVQCNLAYSWLMAADLSEADLSGTLLLEANLGGTRFQGTCLSGTQFPGTYMCDTYISDVDLNPARYLGMVNHRGPSNVGTNTLELTAANMSRKNSSLREVVDFLRGTGVAEVFIDLPHVIGRYQGGNYSCFISYSHTDKSFACRLHDHLQARGLRCWLDEHDLKPGDRILNVVNDAIRLHDKILLCCSEASINSWWVKDKIRKAMERERRDGRDIIIPLMVDRYLLDGWEDGLAADLRSRLAADFTGWEHDNAKFEEQFERVVRALRTDEGPRERAPESTL